MQPQQQSQKDLGFESVNPTPKTIPLSDIRPTEVSSSDVDASIGAFGVTTTPLVQETPGDPEHTFRVVDGRRRIEALRDTEGREQVHVQVIGADLDAEADALTVAHNVCRSPSPLEEAEALRDLIDSGYTKEAVSRLGIPIPTIKKRLRLASAPQTIKDAVRRDQIAEGVAEKVANLSVENQKACVEHFRQEGQLRHKDVKQVRQRTLDDRAEQLPGELFEGDPAGDGAPSEGTPSEDTPSGNAPSEEAQPSDDPLRLAKHAAREAVDGGTPPSKVMGEIREAVFDNAVA